MPSTTHIDIRATGEVIIDETSGVVRTGSTELIPVGGGAAVTAIGDQEVVEIHGVLPLAYIYANIPRSIKDVFNDTYMYNATGKSWLEFSDKAAVAADDIFFHTKSHFHIDVRYTATNPGTGQFIFAFLGNHNPASLLHLNPLPESHIIPGGSINDPGKKRFTFDTTMDELSHFNNGFGGGYSLRLLHEGGGLIDVSTTIEVER